jgi:hypothetical protein
MTPLILHPTALASIAASPSARRRTRDGARIAARRRAAPARALLAFAALVLVALAIAACGGGGGGDGGGGESPPVVVTPPQSATRVVGQSAVLRVDAAGSGLSFEWQQRRGAGAWEPAKGTMVTNAFGSELAVPSVSLEQDETYYRVRIQNSLGQVTSAEARLDVVWGVVETLEPNTEFSFGGDGGSAGSSDGGSPAGGDGDGVGAGGGLGKTLQVRIALARTLDATELGSALTGATSGLVRIKAGPGTAPALLTLNGTDSSTYFDEGKGNLLPIGPEQQLHSLVLAFDQHLGITTISEAAYRYALNHFLVDPDQVRGGATPLQRRATAEELKRLTPEQIEQAHQAILAEINRQLPARYQLVSVATLPTPVDQNSGRGTITNNRYGIMQAVTGGLALAAGRFNGSLERPALTMAAQLADDLTDGVIDGKRLDQGSAFEGSGAAYDPATFARDLTAAADAQFEQYGDGSVVAAPTITEQPQSATITEGGTVTLVVRAGGSALAYQWFRDGAAIDGATASSHTTGTAGRYHAVVSNPSGSVTSADATVTVSPNVVAPSITRQPASATVKEGGSATFRVEASGTDLAYQWFRAGEAIATATAASFSTGTAGTYHVVVSNSAGSVRSNDATLTVTLNAPVITQQPQSVTIASGETATLSVQARGTALVYQWFSGTAAIQGATDSSYRTGAAGSYRVEVRNAGGSVTSEAATVTVLTKPAITRQPVSVTVPQGNSGTFSVEATGGSLAYQWYTTVPGAADRAIEGETRASFSTTAAGTYYVIVSNRAGEARSNNATLSFETTPVIESQPQSASIKEGDTHRFAVKASGSGLSYQWQTLAGRAWSNIDKATEQTYSTGVAGSYRVVVRNSAGSVTSEAATLTVTETQAPVITKHPESLVINSGSGTFSVEATGLNLQYQWYQELGAESRPLSGETGNSFTTGQTGSYYVIVSNKAGSVRSKTATLRLG